jgi:hypothetical protein
MVFFWFDCPITGWSSNTVSSADTDTRIVDFTARLNSGTHTSNANWQILPNLTAVTDTHAGFNGTTGYVIPVSGFYRISNKVSFAANPTGTRGCSVYRNGSPVNGGAVLTQAGNGTGSGVVNSFDVQLNAGDILTFYAYQNSGGNLNYETSSDAQTLISINRLSGPAVIQATETVAARYAGTNGASLPNQTFVQIKYQTKSFDTHGIYSPSTGYVTIPVSGKYSIRAAYATTTTSGTWIATTSIYKSVDNGSTFTAQSFALQPMTGDGFFGNSTTSTISTSLNLNAGDVLRFNAVQNTGPQTLSSDSNLCYFDIVRTGN